VNLAFRSLIALLFLAPTALHADDWPMLGGKPDRSQVSPEKGFPETWDAGEKKNIKWVVDLGKNTYSNPVIAGGRVFIGTDNGQPRDPAVTGDKGVLMCFSAADGKFLWQAVHDKLPGGMEVDAPSIGICSTPQVRGDVLFYVSNRDELVCRKVTDGAVVWQLDMRKELGALQDQAAVCSPLLVDDLLFVVTGNSHDMKAEKVVNSKAPSFIAVNATSGKLVWQNNAPGDKILSSEWGSPAYGIVEGQPQVVFPGGDAWLYAFEPATGKPLWKFNCKSHEKIGTDGTPETRNTLVATPVFAGNSVIASLGIDTDTNGPGCLRAVDARKKGDVTKDGEVWRFSGDAFGVSISSVAVHDGLVYATELGGFVNCIELATGKRLWRQDLLANIWGSPLVADGKVYVRTGDGDVVTFKAGREAKLISRNDKLPGLSQGNVVPSNGVLYIAGSSKLWAVADTK
jgi:outer membrane protein assembly factor BamB